MDRSRGGVPSPGPARALSQPPGPEERGPGRTADWDTALAAGATRARVGIVRSEGVPGRAATARGCRVGPGAALARRDGTDEIMGGGGDSRGRQAGGGTLAELGTGAGARGLMHGRAGGAPGPLPRRPRGQARQTWPVPETPRRTSEVPRRPPTARGPAPPPALPTARTDPVQLSWARRDVLPRRAEGLERPRRLVVPPRLQDGQHPHRRRGEGCPGGPRRQSGRRRDRPPAPRLGEPAQRVPPPPACPAGRFLRIPAHPPRASPRRDSPGLDA